MARKMLNYCQKKNLCKDYNLRLPAFLAERFTSFWFSEFKNRELLSYARLGKFHLSDKVNKYINSTKLPLHTINIQQFTNINFLNEYCFLSRRNEF